MDLMAKLSTGGFKPNEIYKVHDTGARNFGHGTMWTLIVKNTPDEATVMHAGEGRRHGKGSPTCADGMLYCLSQRGTTTVARRVRGAACRGMRRVANLRRRTRTVRSDRR